MAIGIDQDDLLRGKRRDRGAGDWLTLLGWRVIRNRGAGGKARDTKNRGGEGPEVPKMHEEVPPGCSRHTSYLSSNGEQTRAGQQSDRATTEDVGVRCLRPGTNRSSNSAHRCRGTRRQLLCPCRGAWR